MSSASGSPDENKTLPGAPFLTRRGWRITGAVCVIGSAVMAWNGVAYIGAGWHWLALAAYWATVVVLLLAAVYTVVLDLRFTQLEYLLAEREIFLQTIGSEEFRRQIRRMTAESPPEERGENNAAEPSRGEEGD